jgi:hypothetical protein
VTICPAFRLKAPENLPLAFKSGLKRFIPYTYAAGAGDDTGKNF